MLLSNLHANTAFVSIVDLLCCQVTVGKGRKINLSNQLKLQNFLSYVLTNDPIQISCKISEMKRFIDF